MKLVHWHLMIVLLHLVQRIGDWTGLQTARPPPRCPAHPSTASIAITILLYNGPLLCGFNVPIKALNIELVIDVMHSSSAVISKYKLHDVRLSVLQSFLL